MRKMKSCGVIVFTLMSLMLVAVGSFVYFFNVNDYSLWISKQIERSTGYDIRFEQFENSWLMDKSVTLVGLSLYQQEQQILHINKLTLKVDRLDLWQRQLDINSIHIEGVDIKVNKALSSSNVKVVDKQVMTKQIDDLRAIAWERLHITTINIDNLNVQVQEAQQTLLLSGANLKFNDLLIIDKSQLQTLPKNLDISAQFKQLIVDNSGQKGEFNHVTFSIKGDLVKRQASLDLSASRILVESTEQAPLLLELLQLQLQLVQNKLSLQHFFVKTRSGDLSLHVDAFLAIKFFPKPEIAVKKVILHSLIANNLQLVVPHFSPSKTPISSQAEPERLPVEVLLIKEVRLQNISVQSEAEQLPLVVKSADLSINDFFLIKDNKLVDITQQTQQAGSFTLAFAYFRWQETVIEQFAMSGSLHEKDQGVQVLKQLLKNE